MYDRIKPGQIIKLPILTETINSSTPEIADEKKRKQYSSDRKNYPYKRVEFLVIDVYPHHIFARNSKSGFYSTFSYGDLVMAGLIPVDAKVKEGCIGSEREDS